MPRRQRPAPDELSRIFRAPGWLRDLGFMSWLLVGAMALLVGAILLLSLTKAIVMPLITATIIASVLGPLVGVLERRHVARGLGSALVLLLVVVLGAAVGFLVLRGIVSQADNLTSQLQRGADKVAGWLHDLGVSRDSADSAKDGAESSISGAFKFLLKGAGHGLDKLASLAVFLAFTLLSLVFLLKDGPAIRRWVEGHAGLPVGIAHTITRRTMSSLRGYFGGVTVIAVFNGVLIGLGALALSVPMAGSIAVVNFAGAYIPYVGAWTAGAFTVLVALGAKGPEVAAAMAVIALVANGPLQQVVQPIALGAVLGIHPLAVLIVTIAAGSLFGMVGLVLAAPLTAAVVRISADIARARAPGDGAATDAAPPPSVTLSAPPAPSP
jgi:predicted PurR-regulated permease PerM